jgi:SAM-dependent methyltransferase/uncharacterized protein YbaR (Trm112 family)
MYTVTVTLDAAATFSGQAVPLIGTFVSDRRLDFTMELSKEDFDLLRAPKSRAKLTRVTLGDAEAFIGPSLRPRTQEHPHPFGRTAQVALAADYSGAFPIIDGIPVLLEPEKLTCETVTYDLGAPQYAEAYAEMDFYNREAMTKSATLNAVQSISELGSKMESEGFAIVAAGANSPPADRTTFPRPYGSWLAARYDSVAERECYDHLAPVSGKTILQIGGTGFAALQFLIAGARQAWLITPMLGEAMVACELARLFLVEDRFRCVVGIAEELPFADSTFDAAYSGGCVHHMVTEMAFPECSRVLKESGVFGAIEPWKGPLYALGTRVFGKRENNPFCRPLNPDRVAPLGTSFGVANVVHHGTFTRYPIIALGKLGIAVNFRAAHWITQLDDAVCSLIPGLRKRGSSVALLCAKKARS